MPPKYCEDPMGLGDGTMSDQQVSVSSELSPKHSKKFLKINNVESAWQPLTSNPTEWIQFDFLEPRNITGIVTKGGPKGWVTSYKVKYSHNKKDWNVILDKYLKDNAFLGNFDEDTPQINNFNLPILTTYIQIIPLTWHNNIQLRVELHGCFKPYRKCEQVM